jgi:hypothetical protein
MIQNQIFNSGNELNKFYSLKTFQSVFQWYILSRIRNLIIHERVITITYTFVIALINIIWYLITSKYYIIVIIFIIKWSIKSMKHLRMNGRQCIYIYIYIVLTFIIPFKLRDKINNTIIFITINHFIFLSLL